MGEAKRRAALRRVDERQRACGWDADGAPTVEDPFARFRALHVPSNETLASYEARLAAERAAAMEQQRIRNEALLAQDRAERARREAERALNAPTMPPDPPPPAPAPGPRRAPSRVLMLHTLMAMTLLGMTAATSSAEPILEEPGPPRRRR